MFDHRQSHKSFFTKSDLFFLCVLQPESSAIDKQNVEIEAAQVNCTLAYIVDFGGSMRTF